MPIGSIAMSLEGVLQKSSSNVPLQLGIALYHSLKDNFNIVLYSEQARKPVDYWLAIESLTSHAAVEYSEANVQFLGSPERKLSQVSSLRRRGYKIELIIESEPDASALLMLNGFNVLHFLHSQYTLPQWRPDFTGKPRNWEVLAELATQEAELKAVDMRLKKLDEGSDWD